MKLTRKCNGRPSPFENPEQMASAESMFTAIAAEALTNPNLRRATVEYVTPGRNKDLNNLIVITAEFNTPAPRLLPVRERDITNIEDAVEALFADN